MRRNNISNNRPGSRVIGGLIIVGIGAALLLRNTGFYMPHWLFSWPMILILIGIYSGFKHNFRNNSWLILIGIGGFFLVSRFIPGLGLEPLFWPLVLIAAGILFMLRPAGRDWRNWNKDNFNYSNKTGSENFDKAQPDFATADNSDFVQVRSVFSGVKRSIVSKNFKGGHISSIFGGAEVDLTQADLNGEGLIKFEVLFGGAKLIIPRHWSVQNEIDGIFHGVDDNRKFNPEAGINPGKVLVLKGSVIFGGVEIRSY